MHTLPKKQKKTKLHFKGAGWMAAWLNEQINGQLNGCCINKKYKFITHSLKRSKAEFVKKLFLFCLTIMYHGLLVSSAWSIKYANHIKRT